MDKTYTPAQIEAGFRVWAEQRLADPNAFLSHEIADALSPAERAVADSSHLIACIEAAPEPARAAA